MDLRERFNDLEEAITSAIEGKMAALWTAMPCKIVSFDASKQTAVLQPLIKSVQRLPDGTQKIVSLPQLPDVPMHQPGGGGVSITFAHAAGDVVLGIVASRSIDAWHQSDGEQKQVDSRTHDLSDMFAIPGFKSAPKATSNPSSTSAQIRTDDGKGVVDVHAGQVSIIYDGIFVKVSPGRVDLGGDGGSAVMTIAGPSSKVFAVV